MGDPVQKRSYDSRTTAHVRQQTATSWEGATHEGMYNNRSNFSMSSEPCNLNGVFQLDRFSRPTTVLTILEDFGFGGGFWQEDIIFEEDLEDFADIFGRSSRRRQRGREKKSKAIPNLETLKIVKTLEVSNPIRFVHVNPSFKSQSLRQTYSNVRRLA